MDRIFDTPILFLIFNRPENTGIVFNEIKKIKPQKLYIAADGPRENNLNDKINCLEVRKIIDELIDWDCSVVKLYRDNNLGCKLAVSEAISWFFENEEYGIIIEDDCLPDESFFWFCEKLLNKYENDKRVMMISGMNYAIDSLDRIPESYFFSNYYTIWGWATWKRAWSLYDINMKGWDELKYYKYFKKIYSNKRMANYLKIMFQETYDNKIDSWDVQWFFTCFKNEGLCIIPKYNLISNIGVIGTHFSSELGVHNLLTQSIDVDCIVNPLKISISKEYNRILYKQILELQFGKVSSFFNFKRRIKIVLKKLIKSIFHFFNLEITRIEKNKN